MLSLTPSCFQQQLNSFLKFKIKLLLVQKPYKNVIQVSNYL